MMAIKQEVAVGRSYIVESGSKVTYVILLDRLWNHFGVSGPYVVGLLPVRKISMCFLKQHGLFHVISCQTWSPWGFFSWPIVISIISGTIGTDSLLK